MTFEYTDISLNEFPGEISLVIYSPGCNYYCPWCFNPDLREKEPISFKQVKEAIDEHRDFITAVVLTGGEPFCNPNIGKILNYIKSTGLKIKINTNGTVPKNNYIGGVHYIDYLHISFKYPDLCTCIKPSRLFSLISAKINEYSFVYSSTIFPKPILNKWINHLNDIISIDHHWWNFTKFARPEIFTISQMQVGDCLNPQYNNCKVPSRDELIEISKLFKHIPTKKLIVETKEFGREKVK